jgi:hypothetical protein
MKNIVDEIIRKFINGEEEVIKEVLRQLLKREPTHDDFEYCEKNGFSNTHYSLFIKGICVGTMEFNIEGLEYRIIFTPNENYK